MSITNDANKYSQKRTGSAPVPPVNSLLRLRKTEDGEEQPLHFRRHPMITYETAQMIISRLSFLDKQMEHIRSIVLVGSAAYNLNGIDSDIDIVVICSERGFEAVQTAVCDREIDQMMDGKNDNIEYTVLNTSHMEELFQLSSPFIFSIFHGSILMDDGYLSDHKNRTYQKRPGTVYFTKSLREHVLAQYFGARKNLFKAVKGNKCSELCCKIKQGCGGLPSANIFAKTIMRMLYITLPARGFMPLTKSDAIHFSSEVYGTETAQAVKKAAELARNDNASMDYADYLILKKLAVMLYRESLVAAGIGHEVKEMLKDVAHLMRGNYHHIKDEQLRSCVL